MFNSGSFENSFTVVNMLMEHVLSSTTCQQEPLRLIDVNGKVGMLIIVPFVLLHWLCHSHVPQLNLHIKKKIKVKKRS